jgi:DNA-binding MarR family transcriptional regulator
MDNLYEMPGHLIRRVQQISAALFAQECSEFDLTSVQFAALMAIQSHPQVDATRLSALIGFDRATIGDVLERLETKGWVLRSSTPNDKRVKLLTLSAEGTTVLKRVLPAVRRVQERLMRPLAQKDRAHMVRMLSQLAEVHNDVLPAPLRASD